MNGIYGSHDDMVTASLFLEKLKGERADAAKAWRILQKGSRYRQKALRAWQKVGVELLCY